ncbi:MAG: YIP1 family protein [Alphaproteobacteria bacterium]|nr:MAG: YIP1 family protein [Alphaproteobacteria bacterium]
MTFEWGYLFGMALQTVPEPRKIAREVQSLDLPRPVLWQILALLLVASTFLGVLSGLLYPVSAEELGPVLGNPIVNGITEASFTVLTVFAIYWIGGALGGTGTFDQALLTVIWLQFLLLIVELGVVTLGLFAPGLAVLLWVMGLVLAFWVLSHFIAEMHGFRSAGSVFAGILMLLLVMAVAMSALFMAIGLAAPAI